MKESDYIIKTLKEWLHIFEGIHVRYAYDASTEYHIIEVDPESIRRGNELYKDAEFELWSNFMDSFPDSDLLITAPSEANDMSNILFEDKAIQMDDVKDTTYVAVLINSLTIQVDTRGVSGGFSFKGISLSSELLIDDYALAA